MSTRASFRGRGQSIQVLACRATLALLLALVLGVGTVVPASAGEGRWTQIFTLASPQRALAVAPTNPDLILVGSWNNNEIYGRSENGGRTFAKEDMALGKGSLLGGQSPQAFAFDPKDSSIVYALAGQSLYKSTDGGLTWTRKVTTTMKYVTNVAIPESDPSVVYLAGGFGPTVMKSADHGETWNAVQSPLELANGFVAVQPGDQSIILVAAGGKLFLSNDGGGDWKVVGESRGGSPVQVAFSRDGAAVFASGNSVIRSTDGGKTWQTVLSGKDEDFGAIVPNPTNAAEVFVASSRAIYRSANGGQSFARHSALPGGGDVGPSGVGLAIDRATPQTLYASTSSGLWAYTLSKSTGGLPRTGEPPMEVVLPILLGLGGALVVLGQRVRATQSW